SLNRPWAIGHHWRRLRGLCDLWIILLAKRPVSPGGPSRFSILFNVQSRGCKETVPSCGAACGFLDRSRGLLSTTRARTRKPRAFLDCPTVVRTFIGGDVLLPAMAIFAALIVYAMIKSKRRGRVCIFKYPHLLFAARADDDCSAHRDNAAFRSLGAKRNTLTEPDLRVHDFVSHSRRLPRGQPAATPKSPGGPRLRACR